MCLCCRTNRRKPLIQPAGHSPLPAPTALLPATRQCWSAEVVPNISWHSDCNQEVTWWPPRSPAQSSVCPPPVAVMKTASRAQSQSSPPLVQMRHYAPRVYPFLFPSVISSLPQLPPVLPHRLQIQQPSSSTPSPVGEFSFHSSKCSCEEVAFSFRSCAVISPNYVPVLVLTVISWISVMVKMCKNANLYLRTFTQSAKHAKK